MPKPDVNIESKTNARFQYYRSLLTSKGIKKERAFIISGTKIISEWVRSPAAKRSRFKVISWLLPSGGGQLPAAEMHGGEFERVHLAAPLFEELDVLGTHAPMLVVEFQELPAWQEMPASQTPELLPILPLGDPRNLGAVVRSALAFGIESFVLTQESAHPFLPQTIKASAGAVLQAHFSVATKLVEVLEQLSASEKKQIPILALHAEGDSLLNFVWPERAYLIVGEEGGYMAAEKFLLKQGGGQESSSQTLAIPMNQNVESLNAAVALGVVFYDRMLKKNRRS